jgi:hypothetical protein
MWQGSRAESGMGGSGRQGPSKWSKSDRIGARIGARIGSDFTPMRLHPCGRGWPGPRSHRTSSFSPAAALCSVGHMGDGHGGHGAWRAGHGASAPQVGDSGCPPSSQLQAGFRRQFRIRGGVVGRGSGGKGKAGCGRARVYVLCTKSLKIAILVHGPLWARFV